jgi:death-on-curing protein
LLQSALARPKNLAAYGTPDVADLAASYGSGVSRNHPFIDGNKRTALILVELFLSLNRHELAASDVDCVTQIVGVADGAIPEADFAGWLRENIRVTKR